MSNRPIIIIRKRKVAAAGHHGGAWKVAYADFVTAMMAFFLMLWLLSTPDKSRLKGIAEYFQPTPPSADAGMGAGAPQMATRAGSDSPNGTRDASADGSAAAASSARARAQSQGTAQAAAADLRIALMATPQAQKLRSNLKIDPTADGTRIQLMDTPDRPMFRPDTAIMNPYAQELLALLAGQLGSRGARIAIEGHTDAVGGGSDRNWELSGARAQAARTVLTRNGVGVDRIARVVAMAGTRPAFPDEPGRAENRRITIVVVPEAGVLPIDLARIP
jgi:chemotaxis protein MotB